MGYRTSRFIPAGAGNSDLKIASQYWRAVYPRWRGELFPGGNSGCPIVGLSPLARGTRRGIAPARRPESVYPRWRGELNKPGIALPVGIGLSPLARGTL
ncbi:TPA: hypothetical protein JLC30_003295 [Escherichia coli]|nr:hypothetical protein [Escherichia coli]HAV8263414.1 hypothetical protein [Escherichia coli]